jgi:hypothetical protein
MDDLTKFCKPIQQAQAENNGIEAVGCQAIKFDGKDGFVKSLTTNYENDCKVDYFEVIENDVILIELKDIQAKILFLFKKKPNAEEIQKTLLSNVEKKFTVSLSIIQNNINSNLMPTINYLVVANNTENNLLDKYLPENLKKNPFVICKTNEICKKLSTLNTRLCQE